MKTPINIYEWNIFYFPIIIVNKNLEKLIYEYEYQNINGGTADEALT